MYNGGSDPQWIRDMGLSAPYGDDPRDQDMIRSGYTCYTSGICR